MTQAKLNFPFGGEWQQNFTTVNVYKNKEGNLDTLQTTDDFHTKHEFAFVQGVFDINGLDLRQVLPCIK